MYKGMIDNGNNGREKPILDMTMTQYLMQCSKHELGIIAKAICGWKMSDKRKADMAESVSEDIVNNPAMFLNGLTSCELTLLQAMCDYDENICDGPLMPWQHSLYMMRLMEIVPEGKDNKYVYVIPRDLKDAIKDYIGPVIERKEKLGEEKLEEMVLGELNIYGVLTLDKLVQDVTDRLRTRYDLVEYYVCSRYITKLHLVRTTGSDTLCTSPFLDLRILEKILAGRDGNLDKGLDYKIYDDETIRKWGQMPYPATALAAARILLLKMDVPTDRFNNACNTITEYWHDTQNRVITDKMMDNFQKSMGYDNAKMKAIVPYLIDFVESMPMWERLGHTMAEDSAKYGNSICD